jgi:hypothetical protein
MVKTLKRQTEFNGSPRGLSLSQSGQGIYLPQLGLSFLEDK